MRSPRLLRGEQVLCLLMALPLWDVGITILSLPTSCAESQPREDSMAQSLSGPQGAGQGLQGNPHIPPPAEPAPGQPGGPPSWCCRTDMSGESMRQSFRISTRPRTTEWVASGSQLLHIERSHLLLPELCPSSRRKEKAPSDSGKTHYMRIPFPLPAVPRGIFGGKPGAQTGDRLGLQADLCPPWDKGISPGGHLPLSV